VESGGWAKAKVKITALNLNFISLWPKYKIFGFALELRIEYKYETNKIYRQLESIPPYFYDYKEFTNRIPFGKDSF